MGVACLWERRAGEAPDAAAQRICIEALQVVQIVARRGRPVRLRLITRGAVAALSGDLLDAAALAGAPVWGLGRTVMQEHPELDCRLVDVDDLASVARELLVEDGETQVAWRGGRRLVARLVRAKKEERRDPRLEGTVLVTGGLGALGLHVARYFANQKVPHLLLAARRGMETAGAADAIAALEAQGARVTVAAVDVANRAALAEVLERIPGELPLRGVVHAAGVLDDGVIAEQDPERFARVLSPKVAGAWNLHELTAGRPLEVFALFSSVSGLLGAAGQSNYAAANAFLDALAEHRRANGLAGQSLAWGPWSDGGMAARLGLSHKARLERQGIRPWTAADGTALFAAGLGRSDAHLGAVHLDLAAVGSASGESVPPFFRELVRPAKRTQGSAQPPGSWVATIAALDPARREEEVRAAVSADVARVLSWTGPVPPDAPLSELGLDSLMAVEVRNELGRRVGRTLPATVAFDHPTVSALSRYLLQDVLEIERTRKNIVAPRSSKADEPIAIVGFGCRYPGGVDGADSYWKLLSEGIDAVSTVPRERWDASALYDPDPDAAGKMVTREGGFLREIDRFDAAFFGISPREAAAMDPQQRILLETSWEALEHAGLAPAKLAGTEAGVFVGLMYQEYASLGPGLSALEGYGVTGSLGSVASGRLSYVFASRVELDRRHGLLLVARDAASRLQIAPPGRVFAGRSRGVTLMLTRPSRRVQPPARPCPDGRCKSFSAAADGVGWSEGCGILVLKKLADAQRDGDRILALVRGTAVNQDGRSSGLTAPNGPSQEAVIERALQQAGVASGKVSYVECHGTGTRLGDPIEVQALGKVLGPGRERPVVIGSVKSNLGHSQAAAGVAGIIKVVLSLQHEKIPKSLHFAQPSPHIAWGEVPVQVASEAIGWPRGPAPRIAGVSSFGISGTNAHAILQEAPDRQQKRYLRSTEPRSCSSCPPRPERRSPRNASGWQRMFARTRSRLRGTSPSAWPRPAPRWRSGSRSSLAPPKSSDRRSSAIALVDDAPPPHPAGSRSSFQGRAPSAPAWAASSTPGGSLFARRSIRWSRSSTGSSNDRSCR